MAEIDFYYITYFAPILAFLIVFVILFAVLQKTRILGENKWLQTFLSFIIAAVFVAFAGTRDYILKVTPWFAILIVSLVFVILLLSMASLKVEGDLSKWIGGVAVILFLIAFLISGFMIFSHVLAPYVPGGSSSSGNADIGNFFNWFYSARVFGALLLLVVGGIVSWILIKTK